MNPRVTQVLVVEQASLEQDLNGWENKRRRKSWNQLNRVHFKNCQKPKCRKLLSMTKKRICLTRRAIKKSSILLFWSTALIAVLRDRKYMGWHSIGWLLISSNLSILWLISSSCEPMIVLLSRWMNHMYRFCSDEWAGQSKESSYRFIHSSSSAIGEIDIIWSSDIVIVTRTWVNNSVRFSPIRGLRRMRWIIETLLTRYDN